MIPQLHGMANTRVTFYTEKNEKLLVDGYVVDSDPDVIAVYTKGTDGWEEVEEVELSENDWEKIFDLLYEERADKIEFESERGFQEEPEEALFLSEWDEY